MPLTPFDENSPPNNASVSGGAAAIRNLTLLIKTFLTVSFDMTTGLLNPAVIPNKVTTPYGVAGSVYTSTGPSGTPSWVVPGTLVTGMIAMYGLGSPPAGFLNCDGSTPLIATYPTLGALLGTTYGGNGTTTFGLPDLRGRTPVGIGTGTGGGATAWTLNRQVGEETHVISLAEMAAHTHTTQGNYGSGGEGGGDNPLYYDAAQAPVTLQAWPATGSAGSNTAHNNLQPSIGINFVIKT